MQEANTVQSLSDAIKRYTCVLDVYQSLFTRLAKVLHTISIRSTFMLNAIETHALAMETLNVRNHYALQEQN